MEGISGYILSIVGIVILGVLIELILPDGQMSKYIRGIMAFFLVFVMISPIVSFVSGGNAINTDFIYEQSSYELDQNFLEKVNKQSANQLKSNIEKKLADNGFMGVVIEIEQNEEASAFIVEKIIVDIKNMVMNANSTHINKYTEIKNIILQSVLIEEEKIIFNG